MHHRARSLRAIRLFCGRGCQYYVLRWSRAGDDVDATDILAGPILRRVERDLVSVWVALSVPANVDVEVFRGQGARSTLGPEVARKAQAADTDTHTIRVGERLHVIVSIWEPEAAAGLNPGEMYSYDLVFLPDGGSPLRLGDLGLLTDHVHTQQALCSLFDPVSTAITSGL